MLLNKNLDIQGGCWWVVGAVFLVHYKELQWPFISGSLDRHVGSDNVCVCVCVCVYTCVQSRYNEECTCVHCMKKCT